MTLFEKISVLIWLNHLIAKGGRMQALLAKFDGLKSVLGLLMVAAYFASPAFGGPSLPSVVLTAGSSVAGVGLLAKLEKASGIVSDVLGYGHTILDVLQKVVSAVAPKPQ